MGNLADILGGWRDHRTAGVQGWKGPDAVSHRHRRRRADRLGGRLLHWPLLAIDALQNEADLTAAASPIGKVRQSKRCNDESGTRADEYAKSSSARQFKSARQWRQGHGSLSFGLCL